MSKSLVIVESPAKARTINRYLGHNFVVKASMGHVRDLPKRGLGVDIASDFKPRYQVIPQKKKIVVELQNAAAKCTSIILATDPDREGEAISWHLSYLFKEIPVNIYRALLHEITKKSVEEAFQSLGQIDLNKVNAQQTRRILDRLVGYLISPLLWRKIGQGLSAGRVQSIALRLICDREREIRSFVSEEYWTITAQLEASNPPPFKASLSRINGKEAKVQNSTEASLIVEELKSCTFVLEDIQIKEKKKNPYPPYITSTLQQDAFRILHFSVKRTMSVAQRLYEGLEIGDRGRVGLITYMRTDSVRISPLALSGARKYIEQTYSAKYLPPKARVFKNKKKAQDAHEAIRPTSFDLPPDAVKPYLRRDEYSLYTLIWNRFIASQMSPAVIEETEFKILAGRFEFKAKGEVTKFDGFLVLFSKAKEKGEEEGTLPAAKKGEILKLLAIEPKQNFTQPPPRYTEGTLVKELEAKGIGRPSTYAPIITTLQDRIYVLKEKGKFVPTELGFYVTDFLVENFPELMEVKFTARMEEELDQISEGEVDWLASLRRFYSLLEKELQKGKLAESVKGKGIPTEEKCPLCGRELVIREGRYGRFKACSGYPECKYKESLNRKAAQPLEEKCPQCGSQLVLRQGRYGDFVACSKYPECAFKKSAAKKEKKDTGIPCPSGCGGTIVRRRTRRGKFFYGCSRFPKCSYATWKLKGGPQEVEAEYGKK